jgi:hypothetical protein
MPEVVTVGRRSPLAAVLGWIMSLLGREPRNWPPRQTRLG